MKKLLLFINFLLISNLLFSQHSIFTIFSDEGEKFYLYIDGEKINDNPESRITNLKYYNEYINLKVEFVSESIPSIKKNFGLKDMNGNYTKSTLIIKKNKKGQYKIKENSFEVYYPEEDEETESYNNNTSTSSSSVKNNSNENVSMSMNVKSSDNDNASVSFEITATEESSSENVEVSMSISSSSVTTESSSYYSESSYSESSSSSNYQENSSNEVDVDPCLVSTEEFNRMKNNIKSKKFDDSKLTTAKDIVKSKCLKSVQIRDLMKLFSFEDDRLALAIYSYQYVNDKENYYEVYNAFDNEFTIDELKEAINN